MLNSVMLLLTLSFQLLPLDLLAFALAHFTLSVG